MSAPARSSWLLFLALVFLAFDAPSAVAAEGGAVLAIWDIQGDVSAREAARAWAKVAHRLEIERGLRADRDLDFLPSLSPESQRSRDVLRAQQLLASAWRTYGTRDYAMAAFFADEAIESLRPHPISTLPDGIERELHLLLARIHSESGDPGAAVGALWRAMDLDPFARIKTAGERPALVTLIRRVRKDREGSGRGRLRIRANVPGVKISIKGDQAGVADPELLLELPPGLYEIRASLPGYDGWSGTVKVRGHEPTELNLDLTVANSSDFQDQVRDALAHPLRQAISPVWDALETASGSLDAAAVLTARYDGDEDNRRRGWLQVGLYVPGRNGWTAYHAIRIGADPVANEAAAEALAERLLEVLRRARRQADRVASRP